MLRIYESKAAAMALAATLIVSGALMAAPRQQTNSQTSPDNSRTNQRDRQSGAPTADQQPENAADRDTDAKIRSSIMSDKSLSTYAHNIKIITQNGKVTLRGPVRSDEEKKVIVDKAREIAGADNVADEMQVAPPKKSGS
jgi:hyperosmotically inducible protein